jgi:hypothetical protein
MRRCIHLLTHSVVANALHQHIIGKSCAVAGRNASPEKHDQILSRLSWIESREGGSRWTAWGCGRRRRRSGGLLRHCAGCQNGHGDRQHDETVHEVAHRSMPRVEASEVQNPRAHVSSSQGSAPCKSLSTFPAPSTTPSPKRQNHGGSELTRGPPERSGFGNGTRRCAVPAAYLVRKLEKANGSEHI